MMAISWLRSLPMRQSPRIEPGQLDALWQPRFVVSMVLAGEGLALLLALAPGGVGDRWVYFGLASLLIQWVIVLTLGLLYLGRRWLARTGLLAVAWIATAVLIGCAWLIGALAWEALNTTFIPVMEERGKFLARLAAMALLLGLFALLLLQQHWRLRRIALQAKQAELMALQARIRPHFLFNTLNTAAALARQHPDRAEGLLLDLADLFRAALSDQHAIPLAGELELTRRYLDIESLRFGDRLRVSWELPATLPAVSVPALCLQPLAENAIRHGIERLPAGGEIRIAVREQGRDVLVEVANPCVPAVAAPAPGHRIGLEAVRARLGTMEAGRGALESTQAGGRHVATLRFRVT